MSSPEPVEATESRNASEEVSVLHTSTPHNCANYTTTTTTTAVAQNNMLPQKRHATLSPTPSSALSKSLPTFADHDNIPSTLAPPSIGMFTCQERIGANPDIMTDSLSSTGKCSDIFRTKPTPPGNHGNHGNNHNNNSLYPPRYNNNHSTSSSSPWASNEIALSKSSDEAFMSSGGSHVNVHMHNMHNMHTTQQDTRMQQRIYHTTNARKKSTLDNTALNSSYDSSLLFSSKKEHPFRFSRPSTANAPINTPYRHGEKMKRTIHGASSKQVMIHNPHNYNSNTSTNPANPTNPTNPTTNMKHTFLSSPSYNDNKVINNSPIVMQKVSEDSGCIINTPSRDCSSQCHPTNTTIGTMTTTPLRTLGMDTASTIDTTAVATSTSHCTSHDCDSPFPPPSTTRSTTTKTTSTNHNHESRSPFSPTRSSRTSGVAPTMTPFSQSSRRVKHLKPPTPPNSTTINTITTNNNHYNMDVNANNNNNNINTNTNNNNNNTTSANTTQPNSSSSNNNTKNNLDPSSPPCTPFRFTSFPASLPRIHPKKSFDHYRHVRTPTHNGCSYDDEEEDGDEDDDNSNDGDVAAGSGGIHSTTKDYGLEGSMSAHTRSSSLPSPFQNLDPSLAHESQQQHHHQQQHYDQDCNGTDLPQSTQKQDSLSTPDKSMGHDSNDVSTELDKSTGTRSSSSISISRHGGHISKRGIENIHTATTSLFKDEDIAAAGRGPSPPPPPPPPPPQEPSDVLFKSHDTSLSSLSVDGGRGVGGGDRGIGSINYAMSMEEVEEDNAVPPRTTMKKYPTTTTKHANDVRRSPWLSPPSTKTDPASSSRGEFMDTIVKAQHHVPWLSPDCHPEVLWKRSSESGEDCDRRGDTNGEGGQMEEEEGVEPFSPGMPLHKTLLFGEEDDDEEEMGGTSGVGLDLNDGNQSQRKSLSSYPHFGERNIGGGGARGSSLSPIYTGTTVPMKVNLNTLLNADIADHNPTALDSQRRKAFTPINDLGDGDMNVRPLTPHELNFRNHLDSTQCSPIASVPEDFELHTSGDDVMMHNSTSSRTVDSSKERLSTELDQDEKKNDGTFKLMGKESNTSNRSGQSSVTSTSSTSSNLTKSRKLRPMPDMSAFDIGSSVSSSMHQNEEHSGMSRGGNSGVQSPKWLCPPTPVRTPAWAHHDGMGARTNSLIINKVLAACPTQVLDGLSSLENSLAENESSQEHDQDQLHGGANGPPFSAVVEEDEEEMESESLASSKNISGSVQKRNWDTNPKVNDGNSARRTSTSSKDIIGSPICFDADFENMGVLGSGSFADVYKARSREDNQMYAVKRNRRQFRGKRDRDLAMVEVQIMQKLQRSVQERNVGDKKHSYYLYILKFIRAWQEDGHLFCQTELCCRNTCRQLLSSLRFHWKEAIQIYPSLQRNQPPIDYAFKIDASGANDEESYGHLIPETTIWKICHDVTAGLSHIHSHGIVHHDIKPLNIFFVYYNSRAGALCKIGDFGMAGPAGTAEDGQEGDTLYMPQELLSSALKDPSGDIFSFGLCLYELASSGVWTLPSEGSRWHEIRNGSHVPELPSCRSKCLSELIQTMISPKIDERPTADEILSNNPQVSPAGKTSDRFLNDYIKDVELFDQAREREMIFAHREADSNRYTPTPLISRNFNSGHSDKHHNMRTPT